MRAQGGVIHLRQGLFELFGEPWVLFRDEKGAAACVKDECAHRACPLSLGKACCLCGDSP